MKPAILVLTTFLIQSAAFAGKYKPVVIDTEKAKTLSSDQSLQDEPTKYAQSVEELLKSDFKSIDVHLADEGTLKWLFVVISYSEWRKLARENRKELVELLLRHLKKNYPQNGLKVSIGVNANQSLAEGDWSLLSNEPTIKLVGD